MPDPLRKSISASQMAGLFGLSPHVSRWMLHANFAKGIPLPPVADNERLSWGRLMQEPILQRTAWEYRLRMRSNTEKNLYLRRGRIGHTRDGRMTGAQVGRCNVEAKNVDQFIYREQWTERAAPQHIEIQLQVGMYVDKCDRGIIAACVGGNLPKWYEREPNLPLYDLMREEVAGFFEDVKRGKAPPAAGMARELPMLAELYPEPNPEKALERLDDPELRDLLVQYRWAREERAFAETIIEKCAPKILAIAEDCSIIRANSIEAKISKSVNEEKRAPRNEVLFAAQAIRAWARVNMSEDVASWPPLFQELHRILRDPWLVTREESISQRIYTYPRRWDEPLPGDDIVEVIQRQRIKA